jgi:hypothetical protein
MLASSAVCSTSFQLLVLILVCLQVVTSSSDVGGSLKNNPHILNEQHPPSGPICPDSHKQKVDAEGALWALQVPLFHKFNTAQFCRVEYISGGLSNRNYRVDAWLPSSGSSEHTVQSFVLRVPGDKWTTASTSYNHIHLMDRALEAQCVRSSAAAGIGPGNLHDMTVLTLRCSLLFCVSNYTLVDVLLTK